MSDQQRLIGKPIQKNNIEQVHINLSEYKGSKNIDVRSYVDFNGQGYKPTQKGVSIKVEYLGDLILMLKMAHEEAVKIGWIK